MTIEQAIREVKDMKESHDALWSSKKGVNLPATTDAYFRGKSEGYDDVITRLETESADQGAE